MQDYNSKPDVALLDDGGFSACVVGVWFFIGPGQRHSLTGYGTVSKAL